MFALQIFPLLVLVSHGENYTGEAFLDEILKTEIYIRPFWYSVSLIKLINPVFCYFSKYGNDP